MDRIGVIGGGLMGSGITEVCARAGLDTVTVEVSQEAVSAAEAKVRGSLEKAASRGKISEQDVAEAMDRITFTTDLQRLSDRDLVVEAASEREDVKLDLFRTVGALLEKDDAILASNTSSIPIVKLGAVSGRATNVMGVHFFNPAPVMQLVELIPSLTTSPETVERMQTFVEKTLGKQPIEATDRAGFVVNSLLVPYLLSAVRMYEAGYASAADIDNGMVLGCGHPMGPLALSDLIGLDTIRAIGISMYEEFKEPLYSPPPLLDRMVDAGLLGKKSGHGFYAY
ncbi:3-hydroxybutyryl-CoA dehydrogenase [Nocardioides luteus]|uniref:3-hydroxybutyryl-CoA dehydrogenase n=1 Tax=Nocardioides luteus TaxID=1844 RepID=A0ABQ5T1H8_9ACTN|nr:3-hydroxybutyryl-CoA dehydrogenase [Nocardioides luteus]MDR7310287.1 3-hydroxybutyryl-CoA dehydrogenase [Nocardioides luteus]GGR53701.1 3-hydroxybutyryl-CoA dehydrogenase [Nocardioides luteus]GLJ69934.1 3-hydroxybutyryl-CoA dehydrogenase [Nocardioides luteus]